MPELCPNEYIGEMGGLHWHAGVYCAASFPAQAGLGSSHRIHDDSACSGATCEHDPILEVRRGVAQSAVPTTADKESAVVMFPGNERAANVSRSACVSGVSCPNPGDQELREYFLNDPVPANGSWFTVHADSGFTITDSGWFTYEPGYHFRVARIQGTVAGGFDIDIYVGLQQEGAGAGAMTTVSEQTFSLFGTTPDDFHNKLRYFQTSGKPMVCIFAHDFGANIPSADVVP